MSNIKIAILCATLGIILYTPTLSANDEPSWPVWKETVTLPGMTIKNITYDGEIFGKQTNDNSFFIQPSNGACEDDLYVQAYYQGIKYCTGTGHAWVTLTQEDNSTCKIALMDSLYDTLTIIASSCSNIDTGPLLQTTDVFNYILSDDHSFASIFNQ